MKYFFIPVSFLFVVTLASCNQGGSTSVNDGGGSGAWTTPGVGTVYTFGFAIPDSSGIDTLQFTVTSTGQQFAGKSNVVRLNSTVTGQPSSSGDYSIETDGDISLDDSIAPGDIKWTTYPTGSQKTITDPTLDSNEFGELTITTDVRSFIGSESLTTAVGNFSTLHVREVTKTIDIDTADFTDNDTSIQTDDYWFAPSIGFLVKETESETDNSFSNPGDVFDLELIKYSPK